MFLALAFLLSSATSQVLSYQDHIEKLKSLQGNYTKYLDSPFPGLIMSPSSSTPIKVLILSGIHAGYLKNQDFLYSIIENLQSDSTSFDSILQYSAIYFFPVFNEPGHNALSDYYNSTQKTQIFKTDQSNKDSCNETNDAGVNPNHNFEISQSDNSSYLESCSSNYSGTTQIKMVSDFIKFVDEIGANVIINLNREGNTYVKAFTSSNSEDSQVSYTSIANEAISGLVGKNGKLVTSFEAYGEKEFGSLIDYFAEQEKMVVQLGVESNFEDYEKFTLDLIQLSIPEIKVSVSVQVQEVKSDNSTNKTETGDDGVKIMIQLEIEVISGVSFNSSNLKAIFNPKIKESVIRFCNESIQSEYRSENGIDCSDKIGINGEYDFKADLIAFGKYEVSAEYFVKSEFWTDDLCELEISSKDGLFESVKVECEFDGGSGNESNESSELKIGKVIELSSNKVYIINASCVLIFLNILFIIFGLCWKVKTSGSSSQGKGFEKV